MAELIDQSGATVFQGQIRGAAGAATLAQVLALGNDAGGLPITGLDDPAAAQDAATKAYVDSVAPAAPAQATYGGPPNTINNGAAGLLQVDTLTGGPALLNLANPAAVAVLASGLYLSSCLMSTSAALTAGGFVYAQVQLGAIVSAVTSELPVSSFNVVTLGVLNAGDTFSIVALNRDGAAARTFRVDQLQVIKLA